jgi:hypothetical protein
MRAGTVFCILTSVGAVAGQILDPLSENAGRPPDPPLISFIGIAPADRFANDSSIAPARPVARVVYEEFHLQAQGQTHPPTPWQTLTTEFDEQGRATTKIDKNSLGETKSATTYQNGRIMAEISNFTRDGKPSAPEEWNYWTYNAAGLITDFRRGRGNTLENHYTNLKYDQQGRLTSFEYHQGASDALFTRTAYKYVDERRLIEEAVYDEHGERFHSRIEFLDDQGRVVQVIFNDKGSKVQRNFASRSILRCFPARLPWSTTTQNTRGEFHIPTGQRVPVRSPGLTTQEQSLNQKRRWMVAPAADWNWNAPTTRMETGPSANNG